MKAYAELLDAPARFLSVADPQPHPTASPFMVDHVDNGPRMVPTLLVAADVLALSAVTAIARPTLATIVLMVGLVASTTLANGYRVPMPPFWLEGLPARLRALGLPIAAYFIVVTMTGGLPDVGAVGAAAGAMVLARLVALAGIRRARRSGHLMERAVFVGGGTVANRLAESFREHPEYGVQVAGYVDVDAHDDSTLPYLGYVEELDAVLMAVGARTAIVTFLSVADHKLVELLRWAATHHVDVRVVPRMFDVAGSHAGAAGQDHVFGIPLVPLGANPLGFLRWRLKRVFDVVATSIGLVLLLPAIVGLAIGVRLSSPGPILFRQTRIGQHGRHFELLKFRSMRVNDDSDHTWSVRGDSRVTPLGRIMRAYSLDELPQLLNVLKGDMSLVGPRPERPTFVDQFSEQFPSYQARHRVPVGVTGWAQVNGLRGDTSIEARARFDNAYVEQWSLWRDITILLRTVQAVVRHQG